MIDEIMLGRTGLTKRGDGQITPIVARLPILSWSASLDA